jgi:hypothetical protein
MTTPSRTSRTSRTGRTSRTSIAAGAFAEALDGHADGLPAGDEMLLVIVDRLHRLPGSVELAGAAARPDFRSQLRSRLLEEAAQPPPEHAKLVPLTSRWNQSWSARNRVRLMSGIAAGIVGLIALSIAASSSLPGSPFYQLKRSNETVQYALAGSDEARGKLELSFARTRLHEIDQLTEHNAAYGILPTQAPQAAGGSPVLATSVATTVVHLFADMDSEAAKGSALLAKSFRGNPRPGPLLAVQQFARDQAAALTTLRGRLAEPALSKATHSLAWAKQVVRSTTAALATCTDSTCPAAAVTQLGGALGPSLVPSAPPSSGPSGPAPSGQSPGPGLPSQPVVPSSVPSSPPAPSASAPVSAQPTIGQPITSPTGQPTPAPPTDLPPTDVPPTSAPPTDGPTTSAPPTSDPPTTEPPTSDPPTTQPPTTQPPTTQPQPSTPVVVPPTPAPSTPVQTTTPAPPTTEPPTTVPSTTPDPTTQAPPPTSAAPTTTELVTPPPPPRTGRPPLICLPPSSLLGGVCVRAHQPPGVGTVMR